MSATSEPRRFTRLLLVEDDPEQRRVFTRIMEQEGFTVLAAATGAEALAHAEGGAVSVAVVDLGLPDMPGMQLLAQLQARNPDTRFIIHTGHSSFESARQAVNHGAFAYVEKGGDPAELIRHVHAARQWHLDRYAGGLEALAAARAAELGRANEALKAEIAQHQKAQQALRQSQERFELAVRGSSDGLWDWDLAGDGIWCSQRVRELLGYDADEISSDYQTWRALLHPDDLEPAHQAVRRHFDRGKAYDQEMRLKTKDDGYRWFRARGVAARDAAGKPVRMAGSIQDITERRQIEEALRDSEERYRQLFRTELDAILVFDAATLRFMDVNPAAEQLYGYTREEFLCMCVPQISAEPDKTIAALEVVAAGDLTRVTVRRHRRKDGTAFPVEISPGAFTTKGRKVLCGIVRDVTERRQAELELRVHTDTLGAIVETSRDWIWATDLQGAHTYSNAAVESILGYRPGELAGASSFELMHAEDRQWVAARVAECTRTRQGWSNMLIRWRHRDGSWRYLESNAVPYFDDDGELAGFRGVDRDITERKRAEEQLQQQEQRLRLILEHSSDGINIAEIELGKARTPRQLVLCNDRYVAMSGRSREELMAAPDLNAFVDYPDVERHAPHWRRCLEAGEPYTGLASWRRPDGRENYYEWTAAPVRFGGKMFVIGVDRDITERRRAEAELLQHRDHLEELAAERAGELAQTRQQLQRAERLASLGTFAAGIAHEINNPLGAMLLGLEMALAAVDQPDTVTELLRQNKHDLQRCARIVKGVLQFTKDQSTEKWALDLNEVVSHAVDFSRQHAREHGVDIQVRLADGLEPILGNTTELEQVGVNLIHNAVQACADGGQVTVETQPAGEHILLVVRDDGCGMAAEQIEHALDPAYSTRIEQGGTGLGLSTVHGIVAEHGATIGLTSHVGDGTTFTLAFPVHSDRGMAERPAPGA